MSAYKLMELLASQGDYRKTKSSAQIVVESMISLTSRYIRRIRGLAYWVGFPTGRIAFGSDDAVRGGGRGLAPAEAGGGGPSKVSKAGPARPSASTPQRAAARAGDRPPPTPPPRRVRDNRQPGARCGSVHLKTSRASRRRRVGLRGRSCALGGFGERKPRPPPPPAAGRTRRPRRRRRTRRRARPSGPLRFPRGRLAAAAAADGRASSRVVRVVASVSCVVRRAQCPRGFWCLCLANASSVARQCDSQRVAVGTFGRGGGCAGRRSRKGDGATRSSRAAEGRTAHATTTTAARKSVRRRRDSSCCMIEFSGTCPYSTPPCAPMATGRGGSSWRLPALHAPATHALASPACNFYFRRLRTEVYLAALWWPVESRKREAAGAWPGGAGNPSLVLIARGGGGWGVVTGCVGDPGAGASFFLQRPRSPRVNMSVMFGGN
ncbi:Protein of unknown function [Gryllus bimaculatus]|nr:Protein of unknown function [Gryllus bimaculatus]